MNPSDDANPYRRDTTLPYGWDSQLFTPSNPTFTLTDRTLDDWNNKQESSSDPMEGIESEVNAGDENHSQEY